MVVGKVTDERFRDCRMHRDLLWSNVEPRWKRNPLRRIRIRMILVPATQALRRAVRAALRVGGAPPPRQNRVETVAGTAAAGVPAAVLRRGATVAAVAAWRIRVVVARLLARGRGLRPDDREEEEEGVVGMIRLLRGPGIAPLPVKRVLRVVLDPRDLQGMALDLERVVGVVVIRWMGRDHRLGDVGTRTSRRRGERGGTRGHRSLIGIEGTDGEREAWFPGGCGCRYSPGLFLCNASPRCFL